jgi:beta-1,4-mannosyl-glycoprotein beta-1,4-N-acetylglucosaminyltransferase
MKIYDAVLFFNEIDILEIRMNLLDPYVDYFIVSECDTTFSGLPKKFIFEDNLEKFSKFRDKIIHVKNYNSEKIENIENNFLGEKKEILDSILLKYNMIKNTPQTDNGKDYWCRDYLHREYTKLGMENCEKDDIVIFGDTDEIPNLENFKNLKEINENDMYCFLQDNNNFFINNISSTNWKGNIMSRYKNIKDKSLNSLRIEARKEDSKSFIYLNNGGWHLSFMGGTERVIEKIKSYGHQEFNNPSILNNVENNIKQNKDLFFRTSRTYRSNTEQFYFDNMKKIELNGYFPKNIVDLVENKFKYLVK